jgi:hypothetical protein
VDYSENNQLNQTGGYKMEKSITTQPTLGTWGKLPTEDIERKPKVVFDVNIPIKVKFVDNEPREYQGDNGAYYVFEVIVNGEAKVIMTSAWTLLRALKTLTPLKDKEVTITKKLVKGKQGFEVK